MILELAEITTRPAEQTAFDAAITRGIDSVLSKSNGFRGACVHQAPSPERVVFHVVWDTLENHTVDFRQSDSFVQWRALVGPFFAAPPRLEHFSLTYASPALTHPTRCAAMVSSPHVVLADIAIRAGEQADFEAAIGRGIDVALSTSKGFCCCSLYRGIESPERYLLQVLWQTLENYSADWRHSEGLEQWRKIVLPWFASLPRVEQLSLVTRTG